MASIQKRANGWRAQVYVNGLRSSRVFPTKAEAAAWALQREAELSGRMEHHGSVGDALKRFAREVSPTHRGERWEVVRLKLIGRDPIASVPLKALNASHVAAFRDRRMESISGASARRELVLLTSVLETARLEWKWIRVNPCRDVKKPPSAPPRRRRISPDEVERLTFAFGLGEGLKADTAMQRTGLAFLFALETAMRASEITGIRPEHVNLPARYVTLPRTKNEDERDVPLSSRAVEILETLPEPTFDLNPGTRSTLFRRARDASGIKNLHFHDARAEAIWRLSKKLDILELARVIGHRDLKSLMMYYNASAEELAKRLD